MTHITIPIAEQVGFTADDIQRMHLAALQVLDEIGLAIDHEAALELLQAAGVRVKDNRAHFSPELVEAHLGQMRTHWHTRPPAPANALTATVGDMCQYYHNPHNDEIELMTTANVIEATRAVESARDRGLGSYVPGVPRDVPPQLQAIVEYRIGAEFTAGGPTLDTLYPPEALDFLFEMAEAFGQPMRGAGIFSVSPLRLSGYEFDLAVQHRERWQEFYVTTYPAAGVSAPVLFRPAWVLSNAEALGGAVALHIIGGGKPVWFSAGMFPVDMRSMTIAGGLPECAWMYWASAQVNRFYHPNAGYSMMLGTQAKRPGLQAGYEKGMAGALGVMTGCNDLHYIGVLSFDDIFSPEQMLADLELRDALARLRTGIPCDDPSRWMDVIREGLDQGYVQADTTLDRWRESYWAPRLFDRLSWHSFQHSSGKTARQRARAEMLERLSRYGYQPPLAIADVRRIFERAWHTLGGDPHSEVLPLLYNGNKLPAP